MYGPTRIDTSLESGEEKEYWPKLQQNLETCLLEVVIASESFGQVALLHYHKADTVNRAPVLV